MDCIVLGTGGMMPTPLRMTTSVLVRREGRMLLFDAGEGIQISMKRGAFGIGGLDAIAVSHLHADHVLGIPGILMFRAQGTDPGPLTVIGPPGIQRFVRHTIEDIGYYINYDLRFVEWSEPITTETPRPLWSWHGQELYAAPLEHSVFCLGYRLQEADRPGKFDVPRAQALGVPAGPLFGRLQAGESIVLPDGRAVHSADVLGPRRRGRVVAYATDTRPCAALEALCRSADLAFVESMFASAEAADAQEKYHMTTTEAASSAARAGVKRLVLLHLSPRYTAEDETSLGEQAAACFPGAEIGRELEIYPVPLPD